MEDEDEDALKAVEHREQIRHDDRLSIDVEQSKRPRRTKQHYQYHCTFDPRPIVNIHCIVVVYLFRREQTIHYTHNA